MPKPVIYLGPSLPPHLAKTILDACYLPPIKRGDLAKLPADVTLVGIIDGEFYQSLAVSPKEILSLLEHGVVVLGASSIGALRAAELHPYGMIGVGKIFRMYRDGIIDADDEVAQTYVPQTFVPCSEPLINIRYALELAVKKGIVRKSMADGVIQQLQDVYFPYRSYRLVSQLCPELRDFLRSPPSLKAKDARLLLQLLNQEWWAYDLGTNHRVNRFSMVRT
jgi:hypothetical protein